MFLFQISSSPWTSSFEFGGEFKSVFVETVDEAAVNANTGFQFVITDHAYEEALSDNLTFEELLTSIILSIIRAV